MRVPLADVGRSGRMELTFSLQGGRTILQDSYCEVPFKITRILNPHSAVAHVILMHSTAGLFGGDKLECSIRVARGARVRITQQSATKIHPSENRPAIQRLAVSVEPGAELHLHMEPVIPFADSRLQQTTQLEIALGGTFSYWEAFMTGRVGRGESWRFRELSSETRLTSGNRLVYLDRFRLTPDGTLQSPWTMGDAGYTGIGLLLGENADLAASKIRQELPEAGLDRIESGCLLTRVVSSSGPEFHRAREIFCRHAAADAKIQP